MKRWMVLALLASAGLLANAPSAAASMVLARSVLGNGGAPAAVGSMNVNSTVGQPAIGLSLRPSMSVCHGYWCGGILGVAAVDGGPAAGGPAAADLEFGLPAPNPSRGRVTFALTLPKSGQVRLMVADVTGRLVATPQDGTLAAGAHALVWDGRGANGEGLAKGVYYARLDLDGRALWNRTIVLVR